MQLEHSRNELQLKFNLNHHNMVRLNCATVDLFSKLSSSLHSLVYASYVQLLKGTQLRCLFYTYIYTEFVFIHVGAHAHAGVPASEVNLNTRREKKCIFENVRSRECWEISWIIVNSFCCKS